MNILFIRELMVLNGIRNNQRGITDFNDLALIMNYSWRIEPYEMIKSMDTENSDYIKYLQF